MTSGYSMHIRPPADPALARSVALVVASLPTSLAIADDGELAAVAGEGDWCKAVARAIDEGAKGIVVNRPGIVALADLEALIAQAETADASAVLRWRWSSHPAVADAVAAWSPVGEGLVLVDTLATGAIDRLDDALLEQLHLLAQVVGPVRGLRLDARTGDAVIARALTADGRPVAIGAVRATQPANLTLRLLRATQALELALPDTDTWRPAMAFRATIDGESRRPPIYESADRLAWRRLRDAVAGPGSRADLAQFAQALRTLDMMGNVTW
jgi:hypothetical protein